MVGELATSKLGEESLRRFAKEAFVKENLPYIMGTISLLAMILATAVSSATAAGMGTVTFATTGSGMSYSSFGWSEHGSVHYIEMPGIDRPHYSHEGIRNSFLPDEPAMDRDLYLRTPVAQSTRYGWSWYNQHPEATALSPDMTEPVMAGSSVTWTAGANDPDGDTVLYKFWLRGPSTGNSWQDMTGWTASNRWTWRTTLSDAGTSSVSVSVKDGRHAGPDVSRSSLTREYTITLPRSNRPPTATGLVPNPGGPQGEGTSVTWTAEANDPDSDLIYYRFWLKGPSTANSWRDMTGWTASNRWTMRPEESDVGENQVNVWIRDGNHAGSDGWDSRQVNDYTIAWVSPPE
ncbi:MAG TPA: hypothetical protein PLZ42_03265 [Methanothrix sp.]|nr:hypothetical protein [Methanothrix sp.]